MPHSSFNSISPVSYKVKTVCPNGGVNGCNTGGMVPTRNSLQGVRELTPTMMESMNLL